MTESAAPLIKITYEKWTPEDLEAGESSEKGWRDDEGVPMVGFLSPDEEESAVQNAIAYLKREGAIHCSQTPPDPTTSIWFSTEPETVDYEQGIEEVRSYHLEGFTPAEVMEIYNAVSHAPRRKPGARPM